jgi:cytochrome c-type biogenesis protein CcmE
MKRRAYYLLGAALLLGFAGFSVASFRDALTPYVSYAEARAARRTVQVAGALDHGSAAYDQTAGALTFALVDPKTRETLRVRYHGLRPANFEDAISIVAIGRFDTASAELRAEKLLVKCPSKYQGVQGTAGAETKTYT